MNLNEPPNAPPNKRMPSPIKRLTPPAQVIAGLLYLVIIMGLLAGVIGFGAFILKMIREAL